MPILLIVKTETGRTVGYLIRWYEEKQCRSTYLSARRHSKKTVEEAVAHLERCLRDQRNNFRLPSEAMEDGG
jgi:hypothetical protein